MYHVGDGGRDVRSLLSHRPEMPLFPQEQRKSCQILEKVVQTPLRGPTTWKGTRRNAWNGSATWQTKMWSIFLSLTPWIDDHQFEMEELEAVGELSTVSSQSC